MFISHETEYLSLPGSQWRLLLEPRYEKSGLRVFFFLPKPTQTGLYNHT